MKPFHLTETKPGTFSLLLSHFSPADAVFEETGHEGGGYDWAAIAKQVIAETPDLKGRMSFDPEGSMFCAYGDDPPALEQLGAELARLFHNPKFLREVIARVPEEAWED